MLSTLKIILAAASNPGTEKNLRERALKIKYFQFLEFIDKNSRHKRGQHGVGLQPGCTRDKSSNPTFPSV